MFHNDSLQQNIFTTLCCGKAKNESVFNNNRNTSGYEIYFIIKIVQHWLIDFQLKITQPIIICNFDIGY